MTTPSTPGTPTGGAESLSEWAGPYVTEMLGRGRALASQPYQAYAGPLTAGPSALQQQAFQGVASLAMPSAQQMTYTPTSFTSEGIASQYMSPYIQQALQPQMDEARRQAMITRAQQMGQLTKAGAYGGSRQAVTEGLLAEGLGRNLANITGTGYQKAFESAQQQFNTEQGRQQAATQQAQQFGLAGLQRQAELGGLQRGIEQEGIAADRAQFEEERMYPYKQTQYMQSLLQGLPIGAMSYSYAQPSTLSQILGGAKGLNELFKILFPEG
jgi:hypothetical protein